MTQRVTILGCRLDILDAEQATDAIFDFVRERAGAQVVTLGTEMVVHAQRDAAFREIVNDSALSLCDTVGLLHVARRRGADLRERVTGVELVEHLCRRAADEGVSVYFFGGAEGVAADAGAILEARFPGLRIAGTRNGFFSGEEEDEIAEAIRRSGAGLLFVGLGSPRQEVWIARHVAQTGVGAAVGIGGSFDVLSGRVRRAPLLWRRFGAEWLYRLIREPRRFRRQLALPYFVWLIALEQLGLGRRKGMSES
ncbi:MAG TPA: WecB/TagA/CpsF family glycosyltransferase [Candidatus Aquilonibacter sp.]|nr:WecB/TagA/CpsF family glycosyltransferase [Candidatus Aquilonibacter sp.]